MSKDHSFASDIYFIGGFGTVAWVDVKEYEALQPDKIAVDGGEQNLKVILKILGNFNRDDMHIRMEVVSDSAVCVSIFFLLLFSVVL